MTFWDYAYIVFHILMLIFIYLMAFKTGKVRRNIEIIKFLKGDFDTIRKLREEVQTGLKEEKPDVIKVTRKIGEIDGRLALHKELSETL